MSGSMKSGVLRRYFNACMQTFLCSCEKKHCFLILHGRRSETFWYHEVRISLLVNLVEKLSKSVNICKCYCKKFTGTIFMDHSVIYFPTAYAGDQRLSYRSVRSVITTC